MSTNDLYIKINNLNIEINKYNNLKAKLTSIINSLNESSASIADLPSTINNSYSLNENDASITKDCKKLNDAYKISCYDEQHKLSKLGTELN